MKKLPARLRIRLTVATLALLTACSSTPPPPDWQANAQDSIERSLQAYLAGKGRIDGQELARARSEIASTGRADLLARIELMHCAAEVASQVPGDCAGFEALRPDAAAAERAYAELLAGRIPADRALLPAQHRTWINAAGNDAALTQALREMPDPLARLVAAGVLFRRGEASPALLQVAVDTASSQGWRRPLLAWLGVQLMRAEKLGDAAAAERLRRRISLVQSGA